MKIGTIKPIVEAVLVEDKRARNDDHYLYCKVIGRLYPELMTRSFVETFSSTSVPRFESVRRARAKIQAQFPELSADADTEAARMLKEEEYKRFAIYG